jgi:hypothetical protein
VGNSRSTGIGLVYSLSTGFAKVTPTPGKQESRLNETEKEFDAYREKALEKEQRLGRMLQDERNKSNER